MYLRLPGGTGRRAGAYLDVKNYLFLKTGIVTEQSLRLPQGTLEHVYKNRN